MSIIDYLLSRAEFVALGVNVLMTLAFTLRGDWAKAMYWLGTCLVVGGVLRMRN